jgi:Protein of unknown function (DUF1579)
MDMPKPGDGHRKLEKLVGNWTGEEKLHPSPWDPRGGVAQARVNNRLSLSGFNVVQDYEQWRGEAVTFAGHGVFSFNPKDNSYSMHWWDSMGMPPNVFTGKFDGDVLTLTSPSAQGQSRAIFDLREPGSYVFKMDVSPDGKQWRTFMEGKYRRS